MAITEGKAKGERRARGRPNAEEGAQIETHLLTVALGEFIAKGYGGASMAQIVRSARVSKTTLYSRFGSKEALFRAIMRQQVEKLAAATALTSAGDPMTLEEGLRRYANRTLKTSLEGDLLAVNRLINSEAHRFPELGLAAVERSDLGMAQVASFIGQCCESSNRSCPDPQALAEAFILMLRGWYINALLADRDVTPAERKRWVDRMVKALVAGCGGTATKAL